MATCKTCKGKGDIKCPKCDGKGYTTYNLVRYECKDCHASRVVKCGACHGTGKQR